VSDVDDPIEAGVVTSKNSSDGGWPMPNQAVRLDLFDGGAFDRGRPAVIEAFWLLVQWAFISSWIPGSTHRRFLLRLFGARIGSGVILKPGIRVKFPWRLAIGNQSWIGERVWIDNLAEVTIGAHCCLSQGAYLCTGSHDWSKPAFDLITRPIRIDDGAWIAAGATIGPGVNVGAGAVLLLGSVAVRDLGAGDLHQGVPAARTGRRRIA
jgi:putative colanic acid biosynthesis acetyltransferase WcaF